ncbi:MAG: hypothetical protein HFG71_03910 [Hungatella sp.]|jgi:small GTP-binding protein|nr:hypothetical protein [Hungatella sp.]
MPADKFAEHNRIKEELLELLGESEAYFRQTGEEKQAQAVMANAQAIRSGEFEVVVVGEFSAGKSTFLNAMMGEKYLPSYTKETTATINYLRHCSESGKPGIVYYADGRVEELDSIDGGVIEQYVSTKSRDMDVSKTIRHLDLFLDSPFLENKVTLIDSPGLNGMKQGLSDITEAQIRRSHAVVFLFSAEQPGKRSDFEFLKKLKDEVKTVFLVLNKIDCIKQSENQTVEDTVQSLIDNYKAVFPQDETLPEVMPVAAYPALVARSKLNLDYPANQFNLSKERKEELEQLSRMGAFEEKLLGFLTNGEKTIRQIREPLERVNTYLERSVKGLEGQMEALKGQQSGADVEARLKDVKTKIESLEQEIRNKRNDIRGAVKTAERNLLEYMDNETERIRTHAVSRIEDLDGADSQEVLVDEVEFMNRFLGKSMKELAEHVEERFREEFFDQLQEQYNLMVDDLENTSEMNGGSGFSFERKLDVTIRSIQTGFEGFEETKKRLEKKISDLETRIENTDVKKDELMALSDQAEGLKAKVRRIQESQDELKGMYSAPPEVKVEFETRQREISRNGLFGKFLDLFGKQTQDYQVEKRDDSERKAYFQEFHEKQQELSRQRQQVENRLEGMYGVERRLEQADQESARLQRELQALREREESLSREFQNSVDQKYEKEVQRIKRKLASQMEEYFEEARPALKRVLKEKRNSYADLFQDLLAQSINAQLDEKKKEYEEYETLRSKANYEKEELLAQKKQLKDRAGELLSRSQALLEKVGGIKIQEITYQKI